ncbi:MAG: ATP-grasp domain-containing protein [Oscillospiraceae bacterium]
MKMSENSGDVPLPPAAPKIGIIFNVRSEKSGASDDAEAEFDSMDTVFAIRDAIASAGFRTALFEADASLPSALEGETIDLAFNIAEGLRGRGREAEVPALLNLLGIPFTGSDETALCLALDKALCKRVLGSAGIKSPRFAVISEEADMAQLEALALPAIVKPNAEGSSKGIPDACVASTREELRDMVRRSLAAYGGSVLTEEYISGREFTVGILGNGSGARVFPPMEIAFRGNTCGDYRVYSFGVKQDYKKYVDYLCPAPIPSELSQRMCDMALAAFGLLGCRDFTRVDFRTDDAGELYFIEMNPLPGLAPGYSDYPMLAEFSGVSHRELVLSVLSAAMERLGPEAGR